MTSDSREGSPSIFNREIGPSDFASDEARAFRREQLDIYFKYVDSGEKVSDRRGAANTFFLSVNSIIVTLIALFWEHRPNVKDAELLAVPLVGALALCFAWYAIIRSYRQLNTHKWGLVGEIESRLALQPWFTEWKRMEAGGNPKKYLKLTVVESVVPLLFAAVYLVGFLLAAFA